MSPEATHADIIINTPVSAALCIIHTIRQMVSINMMQKGWRMRNAEVFPIPLEETCSARVHLRSLYHLPERPSKQALASSKVQAQLKLEVTR